MAFTENSIARGAEESRSRSEAVAEAVVSASFARVTDGGFVAGRGFQGRKTLKTDISCRGIGLHSGRDIAMTLKPAVAGTGIVFHRTDIGGHGARIAATWQNARISPLCTTLADESTGASVMTIEHLMAALSAMEIDDLVIELNGPEAPAMDGSSQQFVFMLECAGVVESTVPRTAWKIVKTVRVEDRGCVAMLEPDAGFAIDFEIDFPVEAIGRQSGSFPVSPDSFRHELMRARTFALVDDLPKMRSMGLGLGGSLENAVVVNGAEILNEGGLRYGDEFVRHKALDAIGDLSLAGRPLLGRYTGIKSSHALNARLLQTLFATAGAVVEVNLNDQPASLALPEELRAFA